MTEVPEPRDLAPMHFGISEDFGGQLYAERHRRRLSLREVAEQSGVPHNTVARIESGESDPRLSNVIALLKWIYDVRSTE